MTFNGLLFLKVTLLENKTIDSLLERTTIVEVVTKGNLKGTAI